MKNPEGSDDSARLDVWTWAVRLFKTRALAGASCKREQVLVNGQRCKASRQVRLGDEIQVRRGALTRTVEVKALLSKRIGAKVVEDFLIDKTPPEEYEKAAEVSRMMRDSLPQREAGSGRPTKRDRRNMETLKDELAGEGEDFDEFVKLFTRPS